MKIEKQPWAITHEATTFVSYISLSSNKQNCKDKFIQSGGGYKKWIDAENAGYKCEKIKVAFYL